MEVKVELPDNLPEEFQPTQAEIDEWMEKACRYNFQTMILSMSYLFRQTPAYYQIIKMGLHAVPLSLFIIKRGDYGMNWQTILSDLTGINPADELSLPSAATEEDGFIKTDVHSSAKLWLQWGQENNLVQIDWENMQRPDQKGFDERIYGEKLQKKIREEFAQKRDEFHNYDYRKEEPVPLHLLQSQDLKTHSSQEKISFPKSGKTNAS